MSPLVVSDVSVESGTDFVTIVALISGERGTVLRLNMTDYVHPVYGLKPAVKAQAGKSVLNRIFVDERLPL